MEQALHSNDDTQLEHCLSTANGDVKLIHATVSRLPTPQVLKFLLKLVAKFEKRPGRAVQLMPWIKASLVLHTSYLMSVPQLVAQLGPVYRVISARLSEFEGLLKLSGRLDLILAQVQRHESAVVESDEPEVVFDEDLEEGAEQDEDDDEEEEEEDDDDDEEDEDISDDEDADLDEDEDDEENAGEGGEEEDDEEDDDDEEEDELEL